MKMLVLANDEAWNELLLHDAGVEWIRSENEVSFMNSKDADAYFNLNDDAADMKYLFTNKPVFINSVCKTLIEIQAPGNVYRINGWRGFIKRNDWEVAGRVDESCLTVLGSIQKRGVIVPDEAGFIAARIISMIINEAYFALSENVSSAPEIDTAMKLGTNYPYGPFEWAGLIGIKPVYELLRKLSEQDERYLPSSLLKLEATKES